MGCRVRSQTSARGIERGLRAASRVGLLHLLLLSIVGCTGQGATGSYGLPNAGLLRGGRALPQHGEGYVLARPGDPTRYGTETLVGALERASSSVARRFPGTAAMRVGDLSSPRGGRHSRHGSHRSGRDADLIFHATDARGVPVQGSGFLAYDRFALGAGLGELEASTAPGVRFLDLPRNWHFVRTLLLDDAALVQWIFCSNGVKAALLRYAAEHEPDPRALSRAASVLHQPTRGNPHADHFHVRVACTAEERTQGCADHGPVWPWLRDRLEPPIESGEPALDDASLIRFLLEREPEPARRASARSARARLSV